MKSISILVTAMCVSMAGCAADLADEEDDFDGVDSASLTAGIGQNTVLFNKTHWGTPGTTYDHNFFVIGTADPPVRGWRTVKVDPSNGRTYQEQFINSSTGWGDLSLIHAHVPAKPGEWWKNVIYGKIGPQANIYVEGKVYFVDSSAHVLYECVSVTTSRDWAAGDIQVWNKHPGVVAEVNPTNHSCKAPTGTVTLWLHLKATATKAGQTGAANVRAWKVGRCADNGTCDL
jgi:hypothetical protein